MNYKAQVDQVYKSLKQAREPLIKELQQYDAYEQDLLHYIELEKYDAVAGSKLLRQLKENRKMRRQVKDELAAIQSALDSIGSYYKTLQKKRVYHYRVVKKEDMVL